MCGLVARCLRESHTGRSRQVRSLCVSEMLDQEETRISQSTDQRRTTKGCIESHRTTFGKETNLLHRSDVRSLSLSLSRHIKWPGRSRSPSMEKTSRTITSSSKNPWVCLSANLVQSTLFLSSRSEHIEKQSAESSIPHCV
jgi:hypothetical protein